MAVGNIQDQSTGEPQGSSRLGLTWMVPVVSGVLILLGLVLWRSGPSGVVPQDSLAPIGVVPEFNLTNRNGSLVSNGDLLGKVWVVDFMFTRCVDACPLLSGQLASLQRRFVDDTDLHLVSITLDPEHDTPAVLSAYASNFKADPQRWFFLTGDKETIFKLSREGFHLGVVEPGDTRQSSTLKPRMLRQVWHHPEDQIHSHHIRHLDSTLTPQPVFDDIWRWLGPSSALAHHPNHGQDQDPDQATQHSARLVLVDRQGRIRQYYHSQDSDLLTRLNRDLTTILREP